MLYIYGYFLQDCFFGMYDCPSDIIVTFNSMSENDQRSNGRYFQIHIRHEYFP